MSRCYCYTFYSYKGGSGRTTTALNTVKHLIDQMKVTAEKPILLIDADLESAGLTYFFGMERRFVSGLQFSVDTHELLKHAKNSSITGRCLSSASSYVPGIEELSQTFMMPILDAFRSRYEKEFDDKFGPAEDGEENGERTEAKLAHVEKRLEYLCSLFSGVVIPKLDRDNLHVMLMKYVEGEDRVIVEQCGKMVQKLDAIQKSDLTEPEKSEAKSKVVLNHLPAYKALDVSHFFEAPEGCVRFLGVNTNSSEAQIAACDAPDNIRAILEACDEQKYSAVVFDCGSGTQSSAYALFMLSDVIVCCMRPTTQFISGTRDVLLNYRDSIMSSRQENEKADTDKASVILLPTAVPRGKDGGDLGKNSFQWIWQIASTIGDGYVDSTFCKEVSSALCEVEVFKWRELILGAKYIRTIDGKSEAERNNIEFINKRYSRIGEDTPEDARCAYETYKLLAKRLVNNS